MCANRAIGVIRVMPELFFLTLRDVNLGPTGVVADVRILLPSLDIVVV